MTTENDITGLLDQRYQAIRRGTNADRWVRASQVRITQANWGVEQRVCDYLAIDKYGSGPQSIHGHEIKVNRSDWLTELKAPEKSAPWRLYCNFWWIVAPTPAMVRPEEVPEGWGLLIISPTTGKLRAKRSAVFRPCPDLPLDVVAGLAYAAQIHQNNEMKASS